jgi:hypothetical protein
MYVRFVNLSGQLSKLRTQVLHYCGSNVYHITKNFGPRCLIVCRLEEERSRSISEAVHRSTSVLVQLFSISPPLSLPSKPTLPSLPHFSLTPRMSDQSGPSHVQALFEAAFQDYERQTGKTLANHPLAEKLQSCDTVESVAAVLREQTETSSEIRGKEKVLKPLKNVLSVLHKLSSASAVNFGHHLGLVRP